MHVLHTRALKGNILKVYRHYAPSQKLFIKIFSETHLRKGINLYYKLKTNTIGEAQS